MFPFAMLFGPDDQGAAQAIFQALLEEARKEAEEAIMRDWCLRTFQWWN